MYKEKSGIEITRIPLFSGIPEEVLHENELFSKSVKFKRKDIIAIEEDVALNLLIVIDGKIKLVFKDPTDNCNEIFFMILSKYDSFGLSEILYNHPYRYSAISLIDSEVIMIPKQRILGLINNSKEMLRNVNREFAELLGRSYLVLRSSNMDIEKKIANVIIYLAEEFGKMKSLSVEINNLPTQSELAQLAGTTRETISRTFNSLNRRKIICLQKSTIIINDYERFKKTYS